MKRRRQTERDIVETLIRRGLVPISGGSPCTPGGTTTSVLLLCKPAAGEVGWTDAVNGNFDILDALFSAGGFLKPSAGGLGFDASAAPNGALPIGNGAGFALAVPTAGAGIVITPGAGTLQIASSGSPAGGSIFAAGTLEGSSTGSDYTTTSATFVDVDAVNLAVSVTVPGAAKFILVAASFAIGGSLIADGAARVQFFAAGMGFGAGVYVNNPVSAPAGEYTLYGVLANPTPGAQTIAMQFRGDGANAFTIFNPVVEGGTGGQHRRVRVSYVVTN